MTKIIQQEMIEDLIITEKITDYSGVLFKTEDMGKEFCPPSIELKMPENWKTNKDVFRFSIYEISKHNS